LYGFSGFADRYVHGGTHVDADLHPFAGADLHANAYENTDADRRRAAPLPFQLFPSHKWKSR